MKTTTVSFLTALLPLAAAWPTAMQMDAHIKRAGSTGRLNTGAGDPDPTFDATSQYVNVAPGSANEFQSPGDGDLRGQCPGLNAAANHGFLPRNGIPTIAQTVTGLGDAYNMSPDLAAALAAIAVLLSGDIPTMTWSIGGGYTSSNPLLPNPVGILGTHDEYENDASVARGDAYLNGGSVGVFDYDSWSNLYSLFENDRLTMDDGTEHSNYVTEKSINNNPYAFWGPFSGLVAPAAMNFVLNFMSNHSAAEPGGYLTQEILKSFFAVSGEPGSFVQHRGQEEIPQNWYRRPGGLQQYSVANVFEDLIAGATIYPGTIRIGGNTGTTNSFTGVDVGDLTGGVFDGSTLLQGNNLGCFAFRAAQAGASEQLRGLEADLTTLLAPVLAPLNTVFDSFACPQLAQFDYSPLEIFPGYSYEDRADPSQR